LAIMIIEPNTTNPTTNIPKAKANTVFAESGAELTWRKNTR